MMKKTKKSFAVLLSGIMALSVLFVPFVKSNAKTGTETCTVQKAYYDEKAGENTDIICNITLIGNGASKMAGITPRANFAEAYSEYFYDASFGVGVWLDGLSLDSGSDYTLQFNLPNYAIGNKIVFLRNDCGANIKSSSISGKMVTIEFTGSTSCAFCVYYDYDNVASDTEDIDWLEPLRTELRIAADPEFGGNINHTAEYTGEFALPTEILQYIKDHPEVTLKYSFYVNDVLQTVTITGKNVVIEEGVDWYGFSYLMNHYGNGSAAAGTGGYTIVSGDTLTSIAAKLGTTVQALAAKNGIKNVDLIYAGAKIAY